MEKYLEDMTKEFFKDKSLDFVNITGYQRSLITSLAPEVAQLINNEIDKTKITHDVVKTRKRSWLRRIWDLTTEPIREVVVQPANTPDEKYGAIIRSLLHPEDAHHIHGATVRTERMAQKIRQMAEKNAYKGQPTDELQRVLVFATVGLSQLPQVYHKAYLDALMTQKVGEGYMRRSSDKAAWFESSVVGMWKDAGCKTFEDVRSFEKKHAGCLSDTMLQYSHRPVETRDKKMPTKSHEAGSKSVKLSPKAQALLRKTKSGENTEV